MSGYVTNIEQKTIENTNFRQVLFTAPNSQLVVMAIAPGEDIGLEIHDDHDQFIRIEAGVGKAILDGQEHVVEACGGHPHAPGKGAAPSALPPNHRARCA